MAEKMTQAERDALDAKVLGIVRANPTGISFAEICDVLMLPAGRDARRPVEGATQRLRRAGSIEAGPKARWLPVVAKAKAKRAPAARGGGKAAK